MEPQRPRLVLIPGHWLGAWAWDEVVEQLRADGICAVALDQPGLNGDPEADLDRLLQPILAEVLTDCPPVLVVHSGAGVLASAVTDRLPGAVRQVIYVDSGPVGDGQTPTPGTQAPPAAPSRAELALLGPLVAGLSPEHLDRFATRAGSMPAATTVEPAILRDPARLQVPTTVICCSMDSDTVQTAAERGDPMFAALEQLTSVTYLDLPTGHWPMWSRPHDLAVVLAAVAGFARQPRR